MSTATVDRGFGKSALPVCLWKENPHRLVGWWEMQFFATKAIRAMDLLRYFETIGFYGQHPPNSSTFFQECAHKFDELSEVLGQLGLARQSVRAMELGAFTRSHECSPDQGALSNLIMLIHHDLEGFVFEAIPTSRAHYYQDPLKDWHSIIDRFACAWDVDEAGKCLALGRFTACVFHLMRVVERAVLELQCFIDKPNPKAHFGSVLAKLDNLKRRTEFKELSDKLKPHREFLIAIIPQLYAVKDSWRDKVDHADMKIIPTGTFTEEMASAVYAATLLLMSKLAAELPRAEDVSS